MKLLRCMATFGQKDRLNLMGFSAKKIDPLFNSPRNIWDKEGQLVGTYFPKTQVIRLMEGDILQVDSTGRVRRPSGELELLDIKTYVLKPASQHKK